MIGPAVKFDVDAAPRLREVKLALLELQRRH